MSQHVFPCGVDPPVPRMNVLVFLVCLVLVCAYGVDVFLVRALAEFVAGLSSFGLEEAACWVVPGLVLGLEVFVSLGRALDRQCHEFLSAIHCGGWRWLVVGSLVLLIQPVAVVTQFVVLQELGPSFVTQNMLIGVFLLVLGLASHLAVLLFSGTYLLVLADLVELRFQRPPARDVFLVPPGVPGPDVHGVVGSADTSQPGADSGFRFSVPNPYAPADSSDQDCR